MATYRCARRLIDPVNNINLPHGGIVVTECQAWVDRFGSDLQLIGDVASSSGVKIHHLSNLEEEKLLPPPNELEASKSADPPLSDAVELDLKSAPVKDIEPGMVTTADMKTIVRRTKS